MFLFVFIYASVLSFFKKIIRGKKAKKKCFKDKKKPMGNRA